MKKMLEKLWYAYEMEQPAKFSREENEILDAMAETEKKLCATLSEEQKDMLEDYKDCANALYSFLEKEAYCKGIRFATAYMVDALSEK